VSRSFRIVCWNWWLGILLLGMDPDIDVRWGGGMDVDGNHGGRDDHDDRGQVRGHVRVYLCNRGTCPLIRDLLLAILGQEVLCFIC
jgi:hypothetical protein